MLFFIFIALFAISVLAIIYTDEMSGWHLLATIAVVLTLIALLISTIGLASVYINADASVAKWETQYESLTYQLENNLYDNDNDIGKKELMDEFCESDELCVRQYLRDVFPQYESILVKISW